MKILTDPNFEINPAENDAHRVLVYLLNNECPNHGLPATGFINQQFTCDRCFADYCEAMRHLYETQYMQDEIGVTCE